MPFNFNDPQNSVIDQKQETEKEQPSKIASTVTSTQDVDSKILGLSEQEVKNPDAIIVTVTDPETPVIVLFGARASGKTMTLIRLTRYLEKMSYTVVPDPIFRPSSDYHYQRMCSDFSRLIHSDYAPSGNDVMSFMLVKVISPSGRTLCQILEAPGEHYFDPDIPDRTFPAYIQNICNIPNRKSWIFIVEENWGGTQNTRDLYAQKIQKMQRNIGASDRIIFTCNKIDKTNNLRPDSTPDTEQIFKNIKHQYPGIFERYVNRNPITRYFIPYNFEFITFSSGTFNIIDEQTQVYTPSRDFHPKLLWDVIKKNI